MVFSQRQEKKSSILEDHSLCDSMDVMALEKQQGETTEFWEEEISLYLTCSYIIKFISPQLVFIT